MNIIIIVVSVRPSITKPGFAVIVITTVTTLDNRANIKLNIITLWMLGHYFGKPLSSYCILINTKVMKRTNLSVTNRSFAFIINIGFVMIKCFLTSVRYSLGGFWCIYLITKNIIRSLLCSRIWCWYIWNRFTIIILVGIPWFGMPVLILRVPTHCTSFLSINLVISNILTISVQLRCKIEHIIKNITGSLNNIIITNLDKIMHLWLKSCLAVSGICLHGDTDQVC